MSPSADPSLSRTYLTRGNYRGPQLLSKIAGRDASIPKEAEHTGRENVTKRRDSVDTNDEPISSSDGEEVANLQISSRNTEKRGHNTRKPELPQQQFVRAAASSRPSKRRKLKDDLTVLKCTNEDTVFPPPNVDVDLFGLPLSQTKSKNKKKYGNRKDLATQASQEEEKVSGDGFIGVPKPSRAVGVEEDSDFLFPRSISVPKSRKSKKLLLKDETITHLPGFTQGSPEHSNGFSIPELPDASTSSTTTNGVDMMSLFDSSASLGRTSRRNSSRSSVPSISGSPNLLELHSKQEDWFRLGDSAGLIKNLVCPICSQRLDESDVPPLDSSLRSLPVRKQQQICHKHKVREALSLWRENRYPDVAWEKLEKFRISKHLPLLRRIMSRDESSHYLDQLESNIKSAEGNRKKIRCFLQEDIVDLIKPGYYGPKGAKIMVNAVSERLSKDLKVQLRSNPILKVVGVGCFVTTVLVPELTTQLVMEDMAVKSQKKAREIIAESSEIGILLNPDDDYVNPNDEG